MMINRSELKSRAKAAFKGKFWKVFAACAVVMVLTATLVGGSALGSAFAGPTFTVNLGESLYEFNSLTSSESVNGETIFNDPYMDAEVTEELLLFSTVIVLILLFVSSILSVVVAIKNILIVNPLNVGLKSYFMNNRKGSADFKDLFSGFTNGKYSSTVCTVFTTNLIVFLWSLLLVVPGIYYKYVYWLVPYICAENPGVSSSDARKLSKAMTDGYKLEIFVLELSFIGWYLLGKFVIFGSYFVEPYFQATYAELYAELRDRAIANGKIKPEEVGLAVPNIYEDEFSVTE